MAGKGSGGNVLAAICSFFIAGLGHLVQGRILKAIIFCALTYTFYGLGALTFGLFWPVGAVFHLWAIISAAIYKGEG